MAQNIVDQQELGEELQVAKVVETQLGKLLRRELVY